MCWAGGQMAGVRYGSGHAGHTCAGGVWGGWMTRGAHRHTSLYSFSYGGAGEGSGAPGCKSDRHIACRSLNNLDYLKTSAKNKV